MNRNHSLPKIETAGKKKKSFDFWVVPKWRKYSLELSFILQSGLHKEILLD